MKRNKNNYGVLIVVTGFCVCLFDEGSCEGDFRSKAGKVNVVMDSSKGIEHIEWMNMFIHI